MSGYTRALGVLMTPQERNAPSVLARVDAKADDGLLAERLGGLQPVQPLDQHEARAVRPYQDRGLLAVLEHAGGDFVHALLLERGPAFDRHVDVGDGKNLALHLIPSLNSLRWKVNRSQTTLLTRQSLEGGRRRFAHEFAGIE